MLIYIIILIISIIIYRYKFFINTQPINTQPINTQSINILLLNIKQKFNKDKEILYFNKNNISCIKNKKIDENLDDLFNYLFYSSKIKLINIIDNNTYILENKKLYNIIYKTNYGLIDLKLISEINKIDNIFKYKLNEKHYIKELKILNNYKKKTKLKFNSNHQKTKLEKETNINYFISNKIW